MSNHNKYNKATIIFIRMSYVYLLESTNGATYVGATVDLERRLRQHNKELVGGAQQTSMRVVRGETWKRVCYVSGFPDWSAALQFEWRFKQISRKYFGSVKMPLHRRMEALKMLLSLERPTTKALAYSEWSSPPEIIWENEAAKEYYLGGESTSTGGP
jgi:predicted GIY-YIG superfamily endonuclease